MTDFALSVNLLLRGGAIALLFLIAVTLWREHPRSNAARLGALFALSVLSTTIASMPGFAMAPLHWRVLIASLPPGTMFLFWLFTRALFDDGFALRPWHAWMWLLLAAAGVAACAAGETPASAPWLSALRLTLGILPVAWAVLSIAQSVASWREDLIEHRRQLRTLIVAATACYTVAQLLVAVLSGYSLRAVFESTANAAGIAVLTLLVAWRLLRPGHGGLFEVTLANTPSPERERADAENPAATAPEPARSPLTALERKQMEALEALMTVDHLYREPALSIGALAARMAMPEHKLRRMINQGLGYRNFSAFLNSYRLADARRWLADPAQADTPILTIAMDAGFQSVGPFNRAFKAESGMTPSEFRRRSGQSPSPPVEAQLAESGIG